MNLPGNYRKGDGVFSVYGHGGGWRIGDHKEDQGPNQGVYMYTADDFDKVMSEKSNAYKKNPRGKQTIYFNTLCLPICLRIHRERCLDGS